MNREEALRLLKAGPSGIQEWNRIRAESDEKFMDLNGADLSGADLSGANFSFLDLGGANLEGAKIDRGELFWLASDGSSRHMAMRIPALTEYTPTLENSVLRSADLQYITIRGISLCNADLTGANFSRANLEEVDLTGANLDGANLSRAIFRWVEFFQTNLSYAICSQTIFRHCNLSGIKNPGYVRFHGPSTIDTETLYRSEGNIPEVFLRGCGVSEPIIRYMPSLVDSLSPIQFLSCFISYSTSDEEFATRLHNDFQSEGIRCWKWDHDARTGKSLWGEIDQAIRVHDKVVLIASEASLNSPQVNREIERAIQEEDRRSALKHKGQYDGEIDVLFPVRLDDYIFRGWEHERKADVTKKMIADARGWDNKRGIYKKIFNRLITDLKTEAESRVKEWRGG